jgi:diacylglycerol kinase family enzyme
MTTHSITHETPFYIVLNTRSGSGKARECQEQMREILTAAGRPHEFLLIEDITEVTEQAAKAVELAVKNDGAVVVGGGDGTINAVAHAVLKTHRPFGVIPQGTFNYLSRTYSIPMDVGEATQALLNARLRPIQVGALNERIFLVNASLGLHPHLLQERENYTKQYGRHRSVAIWAGLATLMKGYRQLTLDIEHDEGRETLRTPSLFVGNNPLQLDRIGLPEAQDVQNHRLAAVIVKPVGSAQLVWLAVRGALGQLGEDANVRNFSFRSLCVKDVRSQAGRRVKVSTDGELVWMRTPLNFSIAPEPLMLMVSASAPPAA